MGVHLMLNASSIMDSVKYFNNLKVGDRIFYKKNGHAMTRRVAKIGRTTVTVIEDGVKKNIRYDRIFKA